VLSARRPQSLQQAERFTDLARPGAGGAAQQAWWDVTGLCRTSRAVHPTWAGSINRDAPNHLLASCGQVIIVGVGQSRYPSAIVTLASLGQELRDIARMPRLIAIDGRAGAGKSRFASALIPSCGDVALVRVDDFLWWGDIEGWWPRLRQEALEPLLAERAARFRARDWEHDPLGRGLDDHVVIEPVEFVVVEGVTSSRRDIADRVDLAFWVEASHGTRLRRGLERDGENMRGPWEHWTALEDEFFAADGARSRARYVVDGDPAVRHDSAKEVVVLTER